VVRTKHTDALLILALRHPDRMEDVFTLVGNTHMSIRSSKTELHELSSIYLIDTIGDMGLAYSLSDVTFVCGSLVKGLMGHNPLEPAHFSNAVLTGKHISSFADSYSSMIAFNAAERILSPTKVGHAVSELFSDPEKLARRQNQALEYAQSRNTVLEIAWNKLGYMFLKATS